MFAAHVGDPEVGRFHQLVRERTTDISAETLFFTLQINKLDDAVLERMLDDPATAHYVPWLRDVRVFRPHQLSDEVERMLHERSVTGSAAWSRLSDETLARLRFWQPVPQVLLPVVAGVQAAPPPSVGQLCRLQVRVSARYGQVYPPAPASP